jgi:hypothetical protein
MASHPEAERFIASLNIDTAALASQVHQTFATLGEVVPVVVEVEVAVPRSMPAGW